MFIMRDVVSALIFILLIIMFSQYPTSSQLDHCLNQTCGNLSVRYPFSIRTTTSPACPSFSSFFELECNTLSGKLYLHNVTHIDSPTPLPVLAMLNDSLIVDFGDFKATFNNSCGFQDYSTVSLPSFPGPYFISDDNNFVSIGCNIYGILYAGDLKDDSPQDFTHIDYSDYSNLQMGGCAVLPAVAANQNNSCGNACCVSPIPGGLSPRYAFYAVSSIDDDGIRDSSLCNNSASCFNPYNYATLFHPDYTHFNNASYGLKLKWALPSNQTKDGEFIQSSDYACSRNANHTIVHVVPGYVCSCNPGYAGDGYSKGSNCSDIDECKDPSTNNCILGSTTCHNTEGGYSCTCNSWFYVGDGHRNGSGCKLSPHLRNAFVITAVILGLALLTGSFAFLAIQWRQRMKRKYFMQNGGLELQAYIAARGRETTRLFRADELKAATNNFSDDMKLGIGGFGTVYKGRIGDGRLVAIKKANRDKGTANSEQFLNEITILMQINHRHIVRLLGCCLETAMPLLVYEYVSNGNVEESLEANGDGMKGWEQRLKVARQTAEALAYLHAAASPPILHGDVKSRNVLLDDNLDVKVADFGTSRLVADVDDEEQVSRPASVQGTIGYLDPEYFQTLELTDKSDVYSLGVMLVELITGLKPIDSGRRFSNLAFLFIDHMQKGRGEELIDPRLHHHDHELSDLLPVTRSSIMAVATLARRCLNLLGTERPSMSHVAHTLRHISQSLQGAGAADIDDEASPLLQQYVEAAAAGINMDAQNPHYHIMSSNSTSMSMSVELFNTPR